MERAMRSIPLLFGAMVALESCASSSSDIAPSYVSPIMYQSYTCAQIAQESQNVSACAAEYAGAQDRKRTNDQIATTVSVIVFWPALFALSGDGNTAAELARLKGQMQALEQASVQKNCGIQFRQAPPQ